MHAEGAKQCRWWAFRRYLSILAVLSRLQHLICGAVLSAECDFSDHMTTFHHMMRLPEGPCVDGVQMLGDRAADNALIGQIGE